MSNKKKRPLVSVIVPYFENPIPGCLESVKNQTYKNIELLAGSEKDFGIKERKGAGYMRNFLAKKAKGDILFFLDADAILLPDAIEKMVEIFEKHNVDAVSCLPVAPNPKETSLLNYLLGVEYEERIRQMGEGLVSVAASTGFGIKKDVFWRVGGFITKYKGGIGEDWHFSTKMTSIGYKIWHSNKVKIYHYIAENLIHYLKKQYHHAKYRVDHFVEFGRIKDEYTKPTMLFQPFSFLAIPIVFISPFLFACIMLFSFFLPLKFVARIYKRKRNPKVFLLLPLSFVRSFVWFVAMVHGVLQNFKYLFKKII